MRQIVKLLHRFRKDEEGAFALVFAVMAIVLIAMGGAAVDFTSIEQARTRTQTALDAAALALQPSIYSATTTTIQGQAQALLVSQLADGATTWANCAATTPTNKAPCVTVATPVFDQANGQLTLTANLNVQMNFVSLVGVQQIPAQIVSVATRKKLNLEVALVLDNSGSMGTSFGSGTRMSVLKDSAKCATNILFYGSTNVNSADCTKLIGSPTANSDVKMALVPFNDEVNIGVGNASQTWLDRTGGLDTYFDNDNFDSDDDESTPYNGNVDRISLFAGLTDNGGGLVPWGGCVEARYNNGSSKQYDTDDTLPDPTQRDTLFTPLFAPDEPDSGSYPDNYLSDTPAACNKTGPCSVSTPYSQASSTTTTTVATTVTTAVAVTKNGKTTTTTTTVGPTTNAGYPTTTTTTTLTGNGAVSATATNVQGGTRTTSTMCSCTGQTILSNTTTSTGSTSPTTSGPTTTTNSGYPKATSTTSGNTKTTVTTTVTTTVSSTTGTTPVVNVITCQAPYAPWAVGASGSSTGSGLSPREMQERLCKYTGAQLTKTIKTGTGPNADCPASAVQPLTASPSTTTAAIGTMVAAGNTNIQEGSAWGFRVLSPTAPFTEGNPYDNATSKVMIVMTDGENTYDVDTSRINGSGLYAAYGYPWDNYRSGSSGYRGRMGDSGWSEYQYEQAINTRLATTCTNAKKAGITIYTIGLATNVTSDPTGNATLLTNCASLPANAYFPTSATALVGTFKDIANQLAALRLAK